MNGYYTAVSDLIESLVVQDPITYSNNSGPHYIQLANLFNHSRELALKVRELKRQLMPEPAPASDDLQVLKADVAAIRELLLQALKDEAPETQYVAALGSAFDGIHLYGPFPDRDSASAFAEREQIGNGWEVVKVNKPIER